MVNAILYVPPVPHADRWRRVCAEYAQRHGYDIAAIASSWTDVERLIRAGKIGVVVAARRDHLPPKREPRLEVVTEATGSPPVPEQQRPRRTDRAGG